MILQNSFEGGTSGTTITTGNSGGSSGDAFDSTSGTVPQFSSSHPAHGGLGAAFQGTGKIIWSTSISGSPTTVWGRVYVYLTATPTVVTHLPNWFTPTSSSTASGFIEITTGGKLLLSAKGTNSANSATTLSLNTLYRLEYRHVLVASGTCTTDGNLYLGDSTTLVEALPQASGTGVSTDTSVNKADYGSTNAVAANTVFIDEVQMNDQGYPGPYTTSQRQWSGLAAVSMGARR